MPLIESLQHPLVKRLVKLRENRRFREEEQGVVIHSEKIFREIAPFAQIRHLLIPEGTKTDLSAEEIYEAPPQVLQKVSGVKTSEDLVAEVKMPAQNSLEGARVLVLDQISDPGNLGTLLRTALGFGWDGVFLVDGTADLFNNKTVRASRGASFKLPYRTGSVDDVLELAKGAQLLVGDTKGRPFDEVSSKERLILVLGSETHGPSPKLAEAGERVTIPMGDRMESLNVAVAGGILTYAFSL